MSRKAKIRLHLTIFLLLGVIFLIKNKVLAIPGTLNVGKDPTTTTMMKSITNLENSMTWGITQGNPGIITADGKMGIGTNSPTAKFDVNGDASTSGSLVLRGTSPSPSTIDILNGSQLDFKTSVGGDNGLTAKVSILNDGRVGIGTTSPSYLVEISKDQNYPTSLGVTNINSASNTLARADIRLTVGNQVGYLFETGSSNPMFGTNQLNLYNSGNYPIGLWTNSAERLTVAGSGNVGIGTTAPALRLDVRQTTDSQDMSYFIRTTAQNAGGGYAAVKAWSSSYGNTALPSWIRAGFAGYGHYSTDTSLHSPGILGFVPAGGHGRRAVAGFFYRDDTKIGTTFGGDPRNAANLMMDISDYTVPTSPVAKFVVNASGNVGIGTTSPGFKLDVKGTANFSDNVTVAGGKSLSFGSTTSQMLNLWSTSYGIGVQSYTEYFRSHSAFAWYKGGTHSDTQWDPGGGTLMTYIDSSGNLTTSGQMRSSTGFKSPDRFRTWWGWVSIPASSSINLLVHTGWFTATIGILSYSCSYGPWSHAIYAVNVNAYGGAVTALASSSMIASFTVLKNTPSAGKATLRMTNTHASEPAYCYVTFEQTTPVDSAYTTSSYLE